MNDIDNLSKLIGQLTRRVEDVESSYRDEPSIRKRLRDLETRADLQVSWSYIPALKVNMQQAFDRIVVLEKRAENEDKFDNRTNVSSIWTNIHLAFNKIFALEEKLKQPTKIDTSLSDAKQSEMTKLYERLLKLEHDCKWVCEAVNDLQKPEKGILISDPKQHLRFRPSNHVVEASETDAYNCYFIDDLDSYWGKQRISVYGSTSRLRDRIIELLNRYGD